MYVANCVSKFWAILFTPVQLTTVACYVSEPLKVRISFRSQNVPPPLPKPLQKHQYIRKQLVTAHFSQLTNTVLTCSLSISLALAFTVRSNINTGLWSKTLSWPERLSVAYCTHIIETKLMLKNWRYTQISMFTATVWPTDMPLVVLGQSVGVVG